MPFEKMTKEQYRSLDADALERRRAEILKEVDGASDEVDVDTLDAESRMCQEEIEYRNKFVALRSAKVEAVRDGAGSVSDSVRSSAKKPEPVDQFDTPEYRSAFMGAVLHGTSLPADMFEMNKRAAVAIDPTYMAAKDVPLQVPTTMQAKVVQRMNERGAIWAKVSKTSIKAGIWFRVRDFKLTATWIDEDHVSEYQKPTDDGKLSFSYYELECRIAQTLLAGAVTFEDFQRSFVDAVADAMVDAIEQAIVRGTGSGQPLGIVNDARVTNVVEMTKEDVASWVAWHQKVKAKMPRLYRNGSFIIGQGTWDTYIETMRDKNDHPVSTTGYNPVTGEEQYRLMGKTVDTVDSAILPDFDAASAGDVFGIFGNLSDYLVNTQPGMPMSTVRWVDHEQNKEKTKCLVALDGKVLDPYGFILLKKKASA